MEECRSCPHLSEIQELQRDATRNSEQHREFYKRFADNEKAIAVSDERYTNLVALITKIDVAVSELKEKPGKKWDSISIHIITCAITLIMGLLFGKYL